MHRALDGWMLVIVRRLHQLKASTTMDLGISIFHFLYDVWPEKLFSTNYSRSVDGKLDENNSNQQVHTAVQQYIQYTILCNHVARNSVLLAESVDTTFAVHQQGEELLEEIPPV